MIDEFGIVHLLRLRLVRVGLIPGPAATDRTPDGAEQPEHRADDHQDHTDDPQPVDVQHQAEDEQNRSEDNHDDLTSGWR
ncbi:hypothetical protein MSMEI_1744 [Mycolicibacterium smegmatis MC2 155]|uniref:Uncharacterized protein n=1 Tax=Mycolicibacterium smegmatis (strain ATCC 700084 / mc(2)155) TaxID=246196 RepID=I7G4W5_MYCS2|nr:hypothetical protein MSMEI_1744 [Mycolicibacterium smegmatis MC2 155]